MNKSTHPAAVRTKFSLAASNGAVPGGPKSRQKISYRPPSAVSPRPAREVQFGTTWMMPHSYLVGSTPYGSTARASPAASHTSRRRPMTYQKPHMCLDTSIITGRGSDVPVRGHALMISSEHWLGLTHYSYSIMAASLGAMNNIGSRG